MSKKLIKEIRRLQKIAGLISEMELGLKPDQLEEDDYDMGTPSGDTDAMNIAEAGDIDLSDTPEFNQYGFKVGDTVYYHLEGGPGEYGVVTDVARNWDEVLHKGGTGIKMWAEFFSDEERADSPGYDTMEEWEAKKYFLDNYWNTNNKNILDFSINSDAGYRDWETDRKSVV